jgi:predicted aspartyl protease
MIRRRLSSRCGVETYKNGAVVLENVAVTDMKGTHHPITWDALVDTGADRSIVPISVCRGLGLAPSTWRTPVGFDPLALRLSRPLYYVRVLVPGVEAAKLLVYGIDRGHILLGRDFLAKLVLAVDSRTQTALLDGQSMLKSALLRLMALC